MDKTPALKSGTLQNKFPRCPDCTTASMLPFSCDGSIIYKCNKCHGLWLTGTKLGLLRNALKRFDFSELEIYVHPIDETVYSIPACTRCQQVLEEFEFAYNSGVKVYRCGRCKGLWMPLRGIVTMVRSVTVGQAIEEDVRALLSELKKAHEARFRLNWVSEVLRALNTRVYW